MIGKQIGKIIIANIGEGGNLVLDGNIVDYPALNFGCGKLTIPDFINFDHIDGHGVDVIGDFEDTPLTELFPKDHFKYILLRHVLEHVPHRVPRVKGEFWFTLINEMIDITQDGGYWDVRSPCFYDALRAPGHTRLIGPGSFWPWERGAYTGSNEQPLGKGWLVVKKQNVRNYNILDPSRFGRAIQYWFVIRVEKDSQIGGNDE